MEPIGGAWIQFNIRYYMFALVFVIFDVETVFLYPGCGVQQTWLVGFHRSSYFYRHPFGGIGLRLA